jgi:hypothetical protein
MRGAALITITLGTAAVLTFACGSLLNETPIDAGSQDGAMADVISPDAGSPTGLPDASTPPDASCFRPETPCPPGTANAGTASTAFDDGCDPLVGETPDGAAVDLSCGVFVSAPSSLHMSAQSFGGFNPFVKRRISLPGFSEHAHVSFDLFIAATVPGTTSQILGLGYEKVVTKGGAGLLIQVTDKTEANVGCALDDYLEGADDVFHDCGLIPRGRWVHIVLDTLVGFAPAPRKVKLSVDDVALFDGFVRQSTVGDDYHFELSNGTFDKGPGAWEYFVDNVVVTN